MREIGDLLSPSQAASAGVLRTGAAAEQIEAEMSGSEWTDEMRKVVNEAKEQRRSIMDVTAGWNICAQEDREAAKEALESIKPFMASEPCRRRSRIWAPS